MNLQNFYEAKVAPSGRSPLHGWYTFTFPKLVHFCIAINSGHITGQTYGTSTTGKPRHNLLSLENTIEEAWKRLVHVVIECMDFRTLIPRYDRPHTLFFLDPPYWKIPGYKFDFAEQDFYDLREILEGIEGNFLMTINDTHEIRDIFSCFSIEETNLRYSCCSSAKGRAKLRTELLVSN